MKDDEGMKRAGRPLQLGFVGGGANSAVGYTHFLASRLDGAFNVAAGCFSRNSEVNEATGLSFGVEPDRCYSSAQAMFHAEDLDAICVLTPTPDHKETVISALQAGFDVICEKALATSVSEAGDISQVLNESGRQLMVTFNYVGYPMVREARAMIRSGAVGSVQQIYCEMPQESFARSVSNPQVWRRTDYEIPCVSLDLGVHVIHMVHYLTSGSVCSLKAAAEATYGNFREVIDTVNVIATCEPDILVNMMWTKAALGTTNGLCFRVFGDQGSLEWKQSDPEKMRYCTKDGGVRLLERGQEGLFEANQPRYNRFKSGHPAGFVEAFANIYADFAEVLCGAVDLRSSYDISAANSGLALLNDIHQFSQTP